MPLAYGGVIRNVSIREFWRQIPPLEGIVYLELVSISLIAGRTGVQAGFLVGFRAQAMGDFSSVEFRGPSFSKALFLGGKCGH